MKPLAKYKNGNYTVRIFSDGTKIRQKVTVSGVIYAVMKMVFMLI